MPKIIDVPGMGHVEFPDGMSDDQISAAIRANMAPQQAAPNNALMSANAANKAIAGIPDAILNTPNRLMNLGKAAVGTIATAAGRPDLAPEPTDDPNLVRGLFERAGFIKPEFEPATTGQRVADQAIQGGVSGLLSPANGVRQAATNMALGAAGGGAAGVTKEATGSDALAMAAGIGAVPLGASAIQAARNRVAANQLRQQQNVVRDQTLADARQAGYVISPSETNPTAINHALEGGSSGKLVTRQLASQRNQAVTNNLARRALGVAENVPLTPALMSQLRGEAYQRGYAPIAQAGVVRPGGAYRRALDDIESQYRGAANSFPDAVTDDVGRMVEQLRVRQFDTGDALKMSQILRDNSSKSYASGDKAMGKAQRAAATAIEDQIERGLGGQGKAAAPMLEDFRAARREIAKTHSVEAALREGTGNVQAKKLAEAIRKGKPLTGELEVIGRAADAFEKNFQSPETMGAVPAISPLDVLGGAGIGAAGAAAMGSPTGALLGALPAVRPLVRATLLSKPYQKMMGTPKYKNSALTRFLAQGDPANPPMNAAMLAQVLAAQQGE